MAFEDKWVRIMADYCAEGVWDSHGACGDPDSLPITPGLREMLRAWNMWYDLECSTDDGSAFPTLDDFTSMGHRLAYLVKKQLPDWRVIYHDEIRVRNKPALDYEYEIKT